MWVHRRDVRRRWRYCAEDTAAQDTWRRAGTTDSCRPAPLDAIGEAAGGDRAGPDPACDAAGPIPTPMPPSSTRSRRGRRPAGEHRPVRRASGGPVPGSDRDRGGGSPPWWTGTTTHPSRAASCSVRDWPCSLMRSWRSRRWDAKISCSSRVTRYGARATG